MGRKAKELSYEIKEIVWKMLQYDKTITYMSETFGISRTTISSLKKRVERRCSIENISRRGRKYIVTSRDYQKLERLVKTHRRILRTNLMKTEQPVSKRTMQLHLHKNGFVRRVAKKKLVIRENNRKKTLVMVQRKLTIGEKLFSQTSQKLL